MKEIKVKTKRLYMVPLSDEEMRSMIDAESDIEMKKAYNEMLVFALENPNERNWFIGWKIVLISSGETVGDLCFKGPADETETVEIGYGIYDEYQGNGYATEAVRAMTKWALDQDGVYFVDGETDKDNEKSKNVLFKNGFKYYREGEEGPRFYVSKKPKSMATIYMCLGLSLGAALSFAVFDSILWMPLGIAFGFAVGSSLDKKNNKERLKLFENKGIKPESEEDKNA